MLKFVNDAKLKVVKKNILKFFMNNKNIKK